MNEVQVGCSCGETLTVLDRAHVAIKVDLAVYSVEAALRAAYKLTDRCYLILERDEDNLVVFLLGKTPADDVTDHVGAFTNELIDQQLREQLERRFEPIRALITAQAFAEGNLLEPDRDHVDYREDPRGIAKSR